MEVEKKKILIVFFVENCLALMLSKLPLYSDSCSNVSNKFSTDYELKKKIGEGTFSDVWLCIRRKNKRELAAKVLKKKYELNTNADTWNDISEVTVAKSVGKHPFLLNLECAYFDNSTGRVILVNELMKKSLFDIIEEGRCPLPDYRIKTYMYQILEGRYALKFYAQFNRACFS